MKNKSIDLVEDASIAQRSLLLAGGLAVAMVAMAVVGAVRAYTPIPYSDAWYGYLGFIERLQTPHWINWWGQHNEHRILLARLFFWIDHNWFGTEAWFLIIVNYLLAALACLLYWRIVLDEIRPKRTAYWFGFVLTIWLFLWCQEENFTWAFQSQFFLAQLVPLCAFYWMHRSTLNVRSREFLIALGFGIASIATMANGILALPLMLAFSLLARQKPIRSFVLLLASAIALFAYFSGGYNAPGHHSSFSSSLRNDPVGLLQYVLIYLGSPFYHVFMQGTAGWIAAVAAGVLFLAAAGYCGYSLLRLPQQNTLRWALMFYILYASGTALGTAGGRLNLGIAQALSSRYTTPAIMAWCALLVLYASVLMQLADRHRKKFAAALVVLAMLAFFVQLKALKSREGELFGRSVAALALELGANDRGRILRVLSPNEYSMMAIEKAVEQKLSVFGTFPLRGVREGLRSGFQTAGLPACQGYADSVSVIEGESKFLYIQGWIFDPTLQGVPGAVRVLDDHGQMIGYAIGGKSRHDVANAINAKAGHAGFEGYLLADRFAPVVALRGENRGGPSCQVQVNLPVSLFSYKPQSPGPGQATVSAANILAGHQWTGSDFSRTAVKGMRVHGSYIASDADVGELSIRITRGDRMYYRSGPTGGRQILDFPGSPLPAIKLPVASEWILIEFSGFSLPDKEFVARFSDKGSGWGEWSAIAVNRD